MLVFCSFALTLCSAACLHRFAADPMYSLMAAFSPGVWVYFVLGVMLSGFFVVNLFLAVIFMEYGAAQEAIRLDAQHPAGTAQSGSSAAYGKIDKPEADKVEDTDKIALLGQDATRSDGTVEHTAARCDCKPEGLFRRPFLRVAESAWLGNGSTGLVVVNVVLMCMPYEGMPEDYALRLENAASIISYIFIVEMAIKLTGLGCVGYWSDGWNCLDGTIVSLSMVEIVLTSVLAGMDGVNISFFRILRMLRMLRVLRILRLMRSWRGLYTIVSTFIKALPQMANLVFLILLTMFMFSLLGMQLFGGLFTPERGYSLMTACPAGICADGLMEKPHYHFDYCGPAMITIFILLTGEWIDAMEPVTALMGMHMAAFYIFVVLLGKYLLMNLLVAVILTEFASEDDTPATARSSGHASSGRRSPASGRTLRSSSSDEHAKRDQGLDNNNAVNDAKHGPASERAELKGDDYSLFLFGPEHFVRKTCKAMLARAQFDQIVILAILISSVCLALDSPRLDPNDDLATLLKKMDLFFTGLFFCEMSIKIVAFGFVCNGKESYLRSAWNQVDFVIVMISLVVLLAESVPQLRPLRVLRVMRVLRPLRLISRNAGMKLIITSLFKAMPAVGNVFGVILALQVVFAIIGMQLFSGKFGYCSNPAISTRDECQPRAMSGVAPHVNTGNPPFGFVLETEDHEALRRSLKGGKMATWQPGDPLMWTERPTLGSFDNFADAMRLLYVMSSGDQWELPMFVMMGANAPGHAAVRDDFSLYAIFPIVWMFIGYIFAINLFVGVVVDNFSRMQKAEDGSATMTPEQLQWAETMKASIGMTPIKVYRPPSSRLRGLLHRIVSSNSFDGFITGVIIANVGVMACDYWGIEDDPVILASLNTASVVFGVVYYFECCLKLTAFGPTAYFVDSWCRFDFFLVCTSLLDQFAAELLNEIMPLPPMLLRVLRVLRILRILRLLKGAKELRDLIVTMILSFPSLFNVGSLLALIIFIYSVLGVSIFTFVNPEGEAGGFTEERNFVSFGSSFLLLFQCLTGDGWSSIMADAMVGEASGRCSKKDGNCGSSLAIPFFISFQIIGSFVFLNLVVAVILENFEKMSNVNTDLVSTSDLELFSEAWAKYDPDADNYIPVTDVPDLLLDVPKPLGVKGRPRRHAIKLCLLLKLETRNGEVLFSDLLQAIIHNNYLQSGADLDELREVVPGVVMPPIAIGRERNVCSKTHSTGKPEEPPGVPLDVLFGMQVFEQEHVQAMLRRMLSRAQARILARGGAADPAKYEVVYVKGGYASEVRKAEAQAARAAKLAARQAARIAHEEARRDSIDNRATGGHVSNWNRDRFSPAARHTMLLAARESASARLASAKAQMSHARERMSPSIEWHALEVRIPVPTRKRLSESRSIMNTRSREVVEQAVDA